MVRDRPAEGFLDRTRHRPRLRFYRRLLCHELNLTMPITQLQSARGAWEIGLVSRPRLG